MEIWKHFYTFTENLIQAWRKTFPIDPELSLVIHERADPGNRTALPGNSAINIEANDARRGERPGDSRLL